jgi:heme exporter protein A
VAHLPFGYLSAGQQRRIALARLLVSHRPLWLLDEPTAALDKRSDRLFADLVRQHLEAGGLAIAATHQPLGLENVRSLELSGIHSAASGEIWA